MTIPEQLFRPRSVAVIGASADPGKISSIPLRNLRNMGYAGRIYAVNPRETTIDGVPCFPDVQSLPETPDLAFLVVPGERALQLATDCARRGTAAAIVASTGFAEAGQEGVQRQRSLVALRGQFGMRVVGPNTNGIYSTHDRLSMGYNAAHAECFEPGEVSVVSHSGALFSTVAELLRDAGIGLSKFVAVGNEADLDLLDFFEHMVADDTSRTILLVAEAVRDGARFRAIARQAHAAGKRVGVLKLGASQAGAASTAAHSSRMAGNIAAYRALFEASGVGHVQSLEALVTFAALARSVRSGWRPAGRRIGITTASGAGGTLMADAASAAGFAIAELTEDSQSSLRAHFAEASVFNPLDVASFGSSRNSTNTVPVLGADPQVDALVAFVHKLQTPAQREAYARGIVYSLTASRKPHIVVAPASLPADQMQLLAQAGVATSSQTSSAFEALRALFATAAPDEVAETAAGTQAAVQAQHTLNEFESMAELDAAGIPTVPREMVASAEAAAAFGERAGWPIVLKGVVDGVAHKSDIGLVHLDLADAAQARQAYQRLMVDIAQAGGATGDARVVAQAMVRGGFEVILGVTSEPALGRFLLVGLGGRQAEAIGDVTLWALPVSRERVRATLAGTTVGRVLCGARWRNPASFDDLVDALMNLQAHALRSGPQLLAIEINPLSVSEHRPVALDALVVRAAV
ncbi:MAG: acetate--CoA ligase family protein [Burkholderiaceae bacterium]|nr:acetate--CoA ligase family protein [Burkholderiaceae bacterium]